MVVIVCRAEVGLTCSQSGLHFDIEESILHAKAFLLSCEILNSSLLRLNGRTEKSVAFLISLFNIKQIFTQTIFKVLKLSQGLITYICSVIGRCPLSG